MTSVTKPEQSKSAAIRQQLPASIREKIEENRARNAIVTQIRGATWAKDISEDTARAVAEYGHRHGIDPVTELEILGGRIYKSAAYYERKGAELLHAGLATAITMDHVEADPRLEATFAQCIAYADDAATRNDASEAEYWRTEANRARREIVRRANERIRFNAPEKAAAVVVTRILLVGATEPVEGCNWCGNGVRPRDPVGDAEPSKTAETRSARRAWKKLVTHDAVRRDPRLQAFARAEGRIAEEGLALNEIVGAEREAITAGHAAAEQKLIAQPKDGIYGLDDDAPTDLTALGVATETRARTPHPMDAGMDA